MYELNKAYKGVIWCIYLKRHLILNGGSRMSTTLLTYHFITNKTSNTDQTNNYFTEHFHYFSPITT